MSGSWKGERTRENYADRASADAVCNSKNAEALREIAAQPAVRLAQTRLSDPDIAAAEAGVERSAGRWSLAKIIEAGIEALRKEKGAVAIQPFFDEWILVLDGEVEGRWRDELEQRVRAFLRDHVGLMSDGFTKAAVREWLDGLGLSGTSKANYRNALHRFCGWLVDRDVLAENPAGGMWIRRKRKSAHSMPTVFTSCQAEAWMHAVSTAECRRLKGWATLCLFAGLRPESEAERLVWSEINFTSGELKVAGRKRGVKPRQFKLQANTLAWLREVKESDREPTPGFFSRHLRLRAQEIANVWLAERYPDELPISWDEDIQRHTYASMRAGQGTAIVDLADEMGTSSDVIYAHYRNPRSAAEVKAFWALRPPR